MYLFFLFEMSESYFKKSFLFRINGRSEIGSDIVPDAAPSLNPSIFLFYQFKLFKPWFEDGKYCTIDI
jgi:hypothetical protein